MFRTKDLELRNNFGHIIEKAFSTYSNKLAVSNLSSIGSSFTYAQLDHISKVIAQTLNHSSGPNERTLVMTRRDALGICAITGCFLSQTVYIPIDCMDPLERIAFILSDSEATHLICDNTTAAIIDQLDERLTASLHRINLDDIYQYSLNTSQEAIHLEHSKTESYMIYTSGTTGRPKGVVVAEGTLLPLLEWTNENTSAASCKKTLQYYSLAFDPSLLEIFSTLLNGQELVVCDQESKKDLGILVAQIERLAIERLFLPISIIQLVSEEFCDRPEVFKSVQEINCGGDRMVITPAIRDFINGANQLRQSNLTIHNQYGPTEATIMVTQLSLQGSPELWPDNPSIGRAVSQTKLYVLDSFFNEVAVGEKGVLYIGGPLLAKGYWNNPELTSKNFITHQSFQGQRLYRTGDVVSMDDSGLITFHGREDHQIKINGLRVECSEVENLIKEQLIFLGQPCDEAVVLLAERGKGNQTQKFLAAAIKTSFNLDGEELQKRLGAKLPSGMVPTLYVAMTDIPLTQNGKIDRRELKNRLQDAIPGSEATRPVLPSGSEFIDLCLEVLVEVSGLSGLDLDQSLFEQTLTSLQAIKFIHRMNKKLAKSSKSIRLNIADLYQYPQLREYERFVLSQDKKESKLTTAKKKKMANTRRKVAIVGMSCRFPNAESLEEFAKLIESHESAISKFSLEELTHPSQQKIKNQPNFVPARGILRDIDLFDAQRFMIPPRVAEVMDPQMRILLEESLKAIDNAIYLDREATGVFYGMSNNTYIDQVEALHSEKCEQVGRWNLATLNEKDYIATQVAHKLNLMGPALSIHTACSTSLVAIVQGVRAIQNGDCDSALCGGVHIDSRHKTGHLFQEGSIFSSNEQCSPYDESAAGTIFSDGVGVIVLKDYDLALEEGNQILGIIVGSGINNDGSDKTSFTAPSVRGQSRSIEMALQEAGISADELSFIEGHGTATPVGDPIEVQALVEALTPYTENPSNKIGLTSVKAQIGHTVAASGVAGVIKAVHCLNKNIIPGTANFKVANPLIDLESTPFEISSDDRINTDASKKYCGISSFGVGGTNAHLIIERPEQQSVETSKTASSPVVITLSGRTPKALENELSSLLNFITEKQDQVNLVALAGALANKEVYSYRKAYVVGDVDELAAALSKDKGKLKAQKSERIDKIIFAAPGQGTQYAFLGSRLYRDYEVFQQAVDRCCSAYQKEFDIDLKNTLFHNGSGLINFTQYTQPCLFVFQYAMLALLDSLHIEADYLIGHSVGEFALATFNGVFTVEEAMVLIGKRGFLMAELPAGKMLSVRDNSEKVADLLDLFLLERQKSGLNNEILSIATINSDILCVVAGDALMVDAFAQFLEDRKIMAKELRTSHAFHTDMMTSILAPFAHEMDALELGAGKVIQVPSSAQDHGLNTREYWVKHITAAVNFNAALNSLAAQVGQNKNILTIDLGPRHVAGQLIKQNRAFKDSKLHCLVLSKGNPETEVRDFLMGLAAAWERGLEFDFKRLSRKSIWCETPRTALTRQSYWAGYPLHKNYNTNKNVETNIELTNKIPHEDTMTTFKTNLTQFIEEKSGFTDLPMEASFLELGLDSLLLTQLSIDLKNEYSVEVGFRDLMDSIDTIDKLGDFLTSQNPALNEVSVAAPSAPESNIGIPQSIAPQTVAAPSSSATQAQATSFITTQRTVTPAMSGDLGTLIQGQMDLMRMHLEIMSGAQMTVNTSPQVTSVAAPTSSESTPMAQKSVENPPVATKSEIKTQNADEELVKGTVNTSKVAFGAQARVNTVRETSEEVIKESVDKIINAYCARTIKSKEYTQKYRKVNADPRVVTGFRPEVKELTYPLVVNRSEDQHLWDIDGNEYVDVTCGFGSNFFGNQNKRITEALHDQLDRGFEIGPQHELAGECAELLCELTGNERAGFCNTGSEAVLGALRISRTITGRQKIVMFKGSYHGINDEVIVRGRGDGKAMPAAAGINPSATKDMILLDYGTDEALDYIRQNAKELAAVIVEPVQSRRSDYQPKAFLQEIRKITEESGTAFIFDEVITGFRIAMGGAQEYFGIRADLVTYGKIIGGGMPIGVVSGKAKFMDALDGGDWQFGDESVPTTAITYFAGTFVRHPLALRALKEVLLILKEGGKDLYYEINQKAQKFVDQLNLFCEVFGAPIKVDNFGGVLKPRFTDAGKNNDLFFALMRLEGVHCYDGFPWFVTLGHREGDLEFVQETWKKCIIQMQTLGLFPKGLVSSESGLGHNDFVIPPQSGSVLVKSEDGKPTWIAKEGSVIK